MAESDIKANQFTSALTRAGVSIWLDDLNREMISSGELKRLTQAKNVVGVTTNPAIFASAITEDPSYNEAIADLKMRAASVSEALNELIIKDVQDACDVLHPIHVSSSGVDGRVSIEVEPEHAHDAAATVARAKELWQEIERPNVMIKIPATQAGLRAISEVTAAGISVNVTLIFGISRYREVASAYMYGLEMALKNGLDISQIHSVASVFISRFDTAVEEASDENAELRDLSHKIGVANAKLVLEAAKGIWSSERALYLKSLGANEQRILWASTGVKSATLSATHYVSELVAANTVNTMPRETLDQVASGFEFEVEAAAKNTVLASVDLQTMTNNGMSYKALTERLELEGLEKFNTAWLGLKKTIAARLAGGDA